MLKMTLFFFLLQISINLIAQNTDSLKCWSSRDKLTWNDFRGKIPESNDYGNAATWYKLNAIPELKNGRLDYIVTLSFKRYESWTTDTSSQDMLLHEQLHFDIAELYARKLRKAIQNVARSIRQPTSKDFVPLIQKLYAENSRMQEEYDKNTIHGVDLKAQKNWNKKVFFQLEELKNLASTIQNCK